MSKKIAYIIHPFRDDKENNEKNMKFIAAVAVRSGTVPIATALYFPHFLNEEDEAERLEGIDCGLTLIRLYDMHMNRINLRTLKADKRVTPEYRDAIHRLKLVR